MPFKDYADHLAAQRKWYARNKDSIRESKKRQKQRKADGRQKPEVCDVCHEPSFRISFDHCHATGKFRGWLCHGCNVTLGHTKDNPDTLRALADYLEGKLGPEKLNG